jgi:hypothetical protein
MYKRFISRMAALAIPLLLMSAAGAPGGAYAQGKCETFKETGKTVCGRFLEYWNEHGGLRQQGYPISNEFQEVSDVDGKTYTVQYFERSVFEAHTENKKPFDVLLSLLGKVTMQQKYPSGPPSPPTAVNPETGEYFPQTGQWVSGEFLDYWKANGGLAQQGYPISQRFPEKSDLDGKMYTVQYFERAVFELHPDNDPANKVLLSQLGTAQFKKKYPNGEPAPGPITPLQVGEWGARGVAMQVHAGSSSAYLEFDCAHASIPVPVSTRAGKLDVTGIYVQETGGPILNNDNMNPRPARFTGTTDGKTLTLKISLTDDNTTVGTFTLTYGTVGLLHKCL